MDIGLEYGLVTLGLVRVSGLRIPNSCFDTSQREIRNLCDLIFNDISGIGGRGWLRSILGCGQLPRCRWRIRL